MTWQNRPGRHAGLWLLVGLVLVSLLGMAWTAWGAPGHGADGQPATPLPWEGAPAAGAGAQALASAPTLSLADFEPDHPADTWLNPVFWIVIGLVVLGSLFVMADFPQPR